MSKIFLAALILFTPLLAAQQPAETDRLVAVGQLWVTVEYFHPFLADRSIDWDKALIDALPKIRAAKTGSEYAAAVQSMLDVLHDPATYVLPETPAVSSVALHLDKRPDGTLVASEATSAQPGSGDDSERLAAAIQSTGNIVFDLRAPAGAPERLSQLIDDPSVARQLVQTPLNAPGRRSWVHNSLLRSGFLIEPGAQIVAGGNTAKHAIVFLLGENSRLPLVGSALLANGKAAVITDSPHYQFADLDTLPISIGQGRSVVVRTSEWLVPENVKTVSHENALPEALATLAKPPGSPRSQVLSLPPVPHPDRAYAEARYPSTEYRILAAYKIWASFRYFFAYKDLMDDDWDDVFTAFLPKFIAAKNAREYNLAVASMITHAADSQAVVQSEELSEYFGVAPVGLRLRLIRRKPVITEVLDPEAKNAGVQAGDIVTKIDGENIVDRVNRQTQYIASSTQQWLGYRAMQQVLNGREGSTAALIIQDQDGRQREVNLKRSSSYNAALQNQRTGDVLKLLPGNIGYADLDRLEPQQVDAMFDKFRNTKAIIFDLRGSAHGTAALIAPHLTDQKDVAVAIVTGPIVLTPDVARGQLLTSSASYFMVQTLPAPGKWKYGGKTVALIDERTIGAAEHAGLFFEVANKTEFIGALSAGADGDVTEFVVPGGITIDFSSRDVRHANGGKLQRLGLQPTVTVAPTIGGLGHGRDEVLEKAIDYLSGGAAPSLVASSR